MNDPNHLTLFITLLITAFLLLGAEIYVPGGVLGSIGAGCMIGAVVVAFRMSPTMGWASLAGVMLLTVVGAIFWFAFFPRSPAGKRLTLEADGATFKIELPHFAALADRQGITRSPLRPSGAAEFDGRRYDVTAANGLWIDANVAVVVSNVRGSRIEVTPLEPKAGKG